MSEAMMMSHVDPVPMPGIRRIGVGDIRSALAAGWQDFLAIPTQLIFLGLLYPVIGFVAARAARGDMLPLAFPLFAGLSLMGPLLAVGMYELSRRREAGLPVSWRDAFGVLRSPAILGIATLGVVLFITCGLWLGVARSIYTSSMGPAAPVSIGAFADALMQTAAGHRLILTGNAAGLLFAAFVVTISVFSFPMMLDRGCSPVLAVQTSIRAVLANPVTMVLWGMMVGALLVLGSLPLFVGLAVAMPVLGHATWHLYRRTVE